MLKGFSVGGSSVNYAYTYEDGKLIRQTYNNTTHTDFLYGKEGLLGFVYNGETYLYQKNVFGDIVKIVNSTGQVVAEYSYTAFGECAIVTNVNNIAGVNPFRYRGYFLETNSGLYYLKSRFYNPITGRFISPDDTKYLKVDEINGLNLYAYANNNPVMYLDSNGTDAILITDYNKESGLPILGHSVLLIEMDGSWYYTDYSTDVVLFRVNEELIEGETFNWTLFSKGTKYDGATTENTEQIYLHGDYTKSYVLAKKYADNVLDYGIWLPWKNCLHYVKKLLREGNNDNSSLQRFFNVSFDFVPALFTKKAGIVNKVSNFIAKIIKKVKKAWKIFKSFFGL